MKEQELSNQPHPLQVLRFKNLLSLQIVTNRVTLWRWIRAGMFPEPIRLGENSIAWRSSDVQRWLDERTPASQNHGAEAR